MKQVLKKLNFLDSWYLFKISGSSDWKNNVPSRLHKGLEEINPEYFLVQENKIIALFFDFTEWEKEEVYSKIWNFWWSPVIFIVKNGLLDIYNWFNFNTKSKNFKKIQENIDLEKNKLEDFSLINMLSWTLWKDQDFEKKNTVDEKLLKNLKNTREVLIKQNDLDEEITTNIIWRLLFSRYLVDRWVKVDEKLQKYFKNKTEFAKLTLEKEKLYNYFKYLKETFNWDLFPVLELEKEKINEKHLNILNALFSWDKISEDKNIQKSLFNLYDFKIIPIELISEIYEQFMWEEKEETSAFYTPSFLVDYILEKTIKKHLKKNKTCKIFDPSCGSWIFLVESLRQIIERNIDNLNKLKIEDKIEEFKKIITDNIFWVDLNEQAINVTIFSLCLTMLDYIEPKDITKFKFPTLKNKNLFISDFFDLENKFNSEIKKRNIDFILGNPPWKSNSWKKHLEYIKKYWKNIVSNKQIAQTFILRLKDFINENTKISLVLPSTSILYNYKAVNFRRFWLECFGISEILELSPVRKEIFSWAIAPTFIWFFQLSNNSEKNIIKHISIKKNIFLKKLQLLVIEKNDIKNVQQKYFLKYDHLWKILLYWNILDFHLIKRLKDNYENIKNNTELNSDSWFQVWWWWKNDSRHLIWKTFLDVAKKKENSLTRFFIKDSILDKFNLETLHRPRKKEIFQEWPKLLCKEWLFLHDLSICSNYTEKDYVFAKSITTVYGRNKILLKSISAILNSDFWTYYLIQNWSYLWVEREIIIKEDVINFPIIENKEISDLVNEIQEKYIEIHKLNLSKKEIKNNQQNLLNKNSSKNLEEYNKLEKEKNILEEKLNKTVLESFDFSESDKDLLNYTKEITIPLINNDKSIFEKVWEKYLENYAKLFLDYFSETWNWENWKYFEIDIYKNKYLVWINFKVVSENRKEKIKFIDNKNVLDKFKNLVNLWESKITDTFYENRDIRWFNKHSFYIIKYNQKKNWHKWIWQADLSEFIWAIMKSWTKKLKNNFN